MAKNTAWHGTHAVPENQMICVAVGPLALVVARRPGEWRIGWCQDPDRKAAVANEAPAQQAQGKETPAPEVSLSKPQPIADPGEGFTVQRFLTRRPGKAIHLRPLLADRPVVTRPEVPLMIPAGDEVTIFVVTPVWVRAELLEPERTLIELPTHRPSDTWYGPNTRRGVVAYASPTRARLVLDNLPLSPHRAITRITVRNEAGSALKLERLSVPAPNLSLFADREGTLWTSSLLVERDSATSPARVTLSDDLPAEAKGAKPVAEPRDPSRGNALSRAFHVLIG